MDGDLDLVPDSVKAQFREVVGLPLTNVVMGEAARRRLRAQKLAAVALSKGKPRPMGTIKRVGEKRGRNDLCPCGSLRKFKRCCGDFRGK